MTAASSNASAASASPRAWPGPASLVDAVSTFRCTAEGRAWQRRHFLTVLNLLSRDPSDAAAAHAAAQLRATVLPEGLQSEAFAALVDCFVAEVQRGAQQRRTFMTRLLSLHEHRAPLHDVRVPLVLPLLAEFETALSSLEPQLRTLFVEDLRGVAPVPVIKQLANIA